MGPLVTEKPDRYFGYTVFTSADTTDVVIAKPPVSDEVLAEYEAVTSVVPDVQPLILALRICEEDFNALVSLPSRQQAQLNALGPAQVSAQLLHEMLAETARFTSAFLASASSFLGQAPQTLPILFRDDASLLADWNSVRQSLHMASTGYRILYAVRNYSQHYALPITGIMVQGQRSDSGAQMTFTSTPSLSRDRLLDSGYKWGKQESDLKSQPSDIPLMPLAKDYISCIRKLALHAARARAADLQQCYEYLGVLHTMFKVPGAGRLQLFEGLPSMSGVESKTEIVPSEQLQWVLGCLARTTEALKSER